MTVQFFRDPREEVFSLAGNSPLPLSKGPTIQSTWSHSALELWPEAKAANCAVSNLIK